MKKKLLIITIFCCLLSMLLADLTEKKTISVDFPKFGVYQSTTTAYYKNISRRDETQSLLQGKGFFGNLLAGFFPNGKNAVIYDLDQKMMLSLDLEKSTYTSQPIEKYFEDEDFEEEESDVEYEEEEYEEEKTFKVLRQELKVIDTKEKKELNQFKTKHYKILYLYEIEEIESKIIYTDSLLVDVYSTKNEDIFEKAKKEKSPHYKALYEAIGLEMDEEQYGDLLGLSWLKILQSMDEEAQSNEMELDYSELKKIEGTPVLIDGTYYKRSIEPGAEVVEKPKKKKKKFGLGGLTSSITKAATDALVDTATKKTEGYKKQMAYRIETEAILFDKLSVDKYKAPEDFTEIKMPGQGQ